MSCFSCFGGGKDKKKEGSESGHSNRGSSTPKAAPAPAPAPAPTPAPAPAPAPAPEPARAPVPVPQKQENQKHTESVPKDTSTANIAAQSYTFRELAAATKHFSPDCLLGEGGLGRVYKGTLENGVIAAVKKLDRNGVQGNKEFLVEVLMLSLLNHPNLVNLIGYCADGDQRLLVYEFMPRGSLEDHLLDLKPEQQPMDWYTRMRIAFGAAQGLEYLHDKANPPVIYRDLKSSNILLDDLFTPRLSDFGLAKLGPNGDKAPAGPSMVMGTYGYCAPEFSRNGQLTPKSDVYSFGVVLLELITGRRAIDTMKPINEQNLVTWAQPLFKDQKRFPELVDPLLRDEYPAKALNQAVAVAAMCLQEEASVRPLVADVVIALSFLIDGPVTPRGSPTPAAAAAAAAEHPKSSSSDSESSDDDDDDDDGGQVGVKSGSKGSRKESRASRSRKISSRYGSVSSSKRKSDGDGSSRYSRRSSRHDDSDGGSGGSSRSSKHSYSDAGSFHG